MTETLNAKTDLPGTIQRTVKPAFGLGGRIVSRIRRRCFGWGLRLLDLKFPTVFAHLSAARKSEVRAIARAGDIFLVDNSSYPLSQLVARAVGSRWSHSAFYAGEGTIVDCGSKPYVTNVDLEKFLNTSDIAIYRPKYATKADFDSALAFALSCINRPFNRTFDLESDESFYCTQLIYRALGQMPNPIPLLPGKVFGKPAILSSAIETSPQLELILLARNGYLKGCLAHLPSILAIAVGAFCGRLIFPVFSLPGGLLCFFAVLAAENLTNNDKWKRRSHGRIKGQEEFFHDD